MFDKTFHIRLDNMTQINIGGTWHPLTDVSHVKRGTGCVVNLKQLSMYFRVHWKKVQFKYALALIIIILTKTARKIFSLLKSLFGHHINHFQAGTCVSMLSRQCKLTTHPVPHVTRLSLDATCHQSLSVSYCPT